VFHPEFRTIATAGALHPVLMAGVVGALPDVTYLKAWMARVLWGPGAICFAHFLFL
jgi:hypothetical protein